jgi:DNA-binding transcriptional ArsR family regulator
MSSIFPLRESVSLGDSRDPRLVDIDDDVADEVFQALSSGTTRQMFSALHETPQTASDLAEMTDTSVQNAQYHLEKLVDADLVEVVDTWYSERGTEMKVYAPTDEALVLFAGDDEQSALRSLLERVVGVVALLLPASAAVAWLARQFESTDQPVGGGATDPTGPVASNGTDPTPTTDGGVDILGNETAQEPVNMTVENATTPTPTPENASSAADVAAAGIDPAVAGLAFFLGGLFVVSLFGLWHLRQ